MKPEEKDLLLKELCARLPYGVKCIFHSTKGDIPATITEIDKKYERVSYKPDESTITYYNFVENIKPYLRPMSDMTELEDKEYALLQVNFYTDGFLYPIPASNMINWLNEHHFDYQGLIERGLALEAPEGMYKFE